MGSRVYAACFSSASFAFYRIENIFFVLSVCCCHATDCKSTRKDQKMALQQQRLRRVSASRKVAAIHVCKPGRRFFESDYFGRGKTGAMYSVRTEYSYSIYTHITSLRACYTRDNTTFALYEEKKKQLYNLPAFFSTRLLS